MHPLKPHQAGGTVIGNLIALMILTAAVLASMQVYGNYSSAVRSMHAKRTFAKLAYRTVIALSEDVLCDRSNLIGLNLGVAAPTEQRLSEIRNNNRLILAKQRYQGHHLEIDEILVHQQTLPLGAAPQRALFEVKIKAHSSADPLLRYSHTIPLVARVTPTGQITSCYRNGSLRSSCEEMGRVWRPREVESCQAS